MQGEGTAAISAASQSIALEFPGGERWKDWQIGAVHRQISPCTLELNCFDHAKAFWIFSSGIPLWLLRPSGPAECSIMTDNADAAWIARARRRLLTYSRNVYFLDHPSGPSPTSRCPVSSVPKVELWSLCDFLESSAQRAARLPPSPSSNFHSAICVPRGQKCVLHSIWDVF